jgi:hypothetical protein
MTTALTEYDERFAKALRLDLSGLPEALVAVHGNALHLAEAERELARHEASQWKGIARLTARRSLWWKAWAITFALWAVSVSAVALGMFSDVVRR